MNIAVQFDKNYLPYTCVMMASLCLNNRVHVEAYVLNSDLSTDDFEEIRSNLKGFDIEIHDLKVDRSNFDKRLPVSEFWTLETYFVLKISELIPMEVDRVLFLDDDLIINDSIIDLYEMDFSDCEIIAAQDSNGEITEGSFSNKQREMFKDILPAEEYFNTGVMLLNLDAIRERCSFDIYVKAMEEWDYEMTAPDQDILNYVHRGRVKFIDWKLYDLFARDAYVKGIQYDYVKNNVKIIHFAGQKPWKSGDAVHFNTEKIWWEYASKTPQYMVLMEGFIKSSLENVQIEKSTRAMAEDNRRLVEINKKLLERIENSGKDTIMGQNDRGRGEGNENEGKYDLFHFEKIKLVIWDMDETLWNGTLSEGTVELPETNRSLLYSLADHGIVNSISSKNDEEPVFDELKKYGICDLFVFNNINWEDKGPQIKDKLEAMGLRAENTLFIDDNPRNLEEAKHYSPEIMTATPDIIPYMAEYYSALPGNDKERKRLDQYKLLEKKTSAEKSSTSKEDFLFESDIRVTINKNCLEELDRIHEMVKRTNQLNYTKKRDDKRFVERLITDDWTDCAYIKVRDRFGDYGIVGFYCYNRREKQMEHFLFSCRVLGMGIEQFVYNKLGCPDFEVAEPVAVKLETHKEVDWIREDTDTEIKVDRERDNRVKVLIKGPCDMSAIEPYLIGGSITTEFNFVNNKGFITAGQNHTIHIYEGNELSDNEIEEIIRGVPFLSKEDFKTLMFENEYNVILLSMLTDCHAGVYRHKNTGAMISFGSVNFDLTDENNFNGYIEGRIQNHLFPFTKEILEEFSLNWEFIGTTPDEVLIYNLQYIYDNVPGNPMIVLLLGSEIEYIGENAEFADHAERHKRVNALIREFAEGKSRIKLIDFTDYIASQEDYEDGINHFSRRVYYDVATKTVEYINEKVKELYQCNNRVLSGKDAYSRKLSSIKKELRKYASISHEVDSPEEGKPIMLAFTHLLNRGGAPLVLMDLLEYLKNTYCVIVISQEEGVLWEEFNRKGFDIYVGKIDVFSGVNSGTWKLADYAFFNSIASNDMIECFQNTSVPVIWWIHEPEEFFEFYADRIDSFSHLSSNFRILSVSEKTKECVKKYFGVDSELFKLGIKDEYGGATDEEHEKIRFFMPSAFIQIKGIDILAQAIINLPESYRLKAEFYFAGPMVDNDRTYYDIIEKLSEAFPETVGLLGEMSREEIYAVYSQCDCVLATSRMDATPTTIVEGMMFEKLCICSDACGISRSMTNGVDGFIFPSENIEALTELLKWVIDNYDKCTEIRKRGRKLFLDSFDSKNTSIKIDRIMDGLNRYLAKSKIEYTYKVSVIIPCFNVEKYITRCIDSVLEQSIGYRNIQIIAVNDASTDTTLSLLTDYEKEYEQNIVVINCEESGGPGGARNVAWRYAKGEYIFYIDADDYLEKDAFEMMIKYADMTGCDYVECGYTDFDDNNPVNRSIENEVSQLRILTSNARREVLLGAYSRTAPWGRLIRRSFIGDHNIFFPEKLFYQDVFFTFLCYMYTSNVVFVKASLYNYYHNAKGITWDKSNVKKMTQKIKVIEYLLGTLKERKLVGNTGKPYADELEYICARKCIVDTYLGLLSFGEINPEGETTLKTVFSEYIRLFPNCLNNRYIRDDKLLMDVLGLIKTAE